MMRTTLLNKKRGARLQKMVEDFVEEMGFEFKRFEDDRADMLMDMADEIFDSLIKEAVSQQTSTVRIRDRAFE